MAKMKLYVNEFCVNCFKLIRVSEII